MGMWTRVSRITFKFFLQINVISFAASFRASISLLCGGGNFRSCGDIYCVPFSTYTRGPSQTDSKSLSDILSRLIPGRGSSVLEKEGVYNSITFRLLPYGFAAQFFLNGVLCSFEFFWIKMCKYGLSNYFLLLNRSNMGRNDIFVVSLAGLHEIDN